MKIAIVSETYPPDVNGVSFTLQNLVLGLQANHHEVEIFRLQSIQFCAASSHAEPRQHVLRSFPVPGYAGLRMGWPSYLALWLRWRTWRPDVVYVATEGPLGWAAMGLALRMGIPVGSGYHTNFCDYLPAYGGRRLVSLAAMGQRRFHNRGAFTLAPSSDTANKLKSQGYERVKVMRRGVDAKRFHPAKSSTILREAWGAEPGDFVVLLVGRVAAEKNLAMALDAAENLRAGHGHMKVVVVGDGPKLAEMKARYPWVHFAGEQRGEALAAHYASGNLLLFPSLTETFGNVLLEAMASCLPTLSFDYAAAREHVVHGTNGWTVPYGNAAAFAEQFTVILNMSPFLLDSIGAMARCTARELSWTRIVQSFEETLETAIAQASAPNPTLQSRPVPTYDYHQPPNTAALHPL